MEYVQFVESFLDGGKKVGMIRGWNGKGCEMTMFFKLTHVLYPGELHMPRWIEYFCDPMWCIQKFTGCHLNECKRMDWKDITDDSQRPPYMRKRFLPCSCKMCFCCKNKLTGRYGPPAPPKKVAALVTPAKKRSSPKSSRPSLTKRAKRGRIVEVSHDHLRPGQKRVPIFEYPKNCSVCMKLGRKRKWQNAVVEGKNNIMKQTYLGCPHLKCREHPVCSEHWEKFKHY